MRASAEEFGTVVHGLLRSLNELKAAGCFGVRGGGGRGKAHAHTVVPIFFQTIKFLSIIDELGAKVLDPFSGLFLFRWD